MDWEEFIEEELAELEESKSETAPDHGDHERDLFETSSRSVLNDMRDKQQLTDAVIKVNNDRFPIHRAVLLACSTYFQDLFTIEEFNSNNKEIVVPGIPTKIMKMIIDFAYTDTIDVTTDNVEQLLPAAEQLHVNGVVKACCDFLISNINSENCIGVHKFAKSYSCRNLERISYRYIMQHFKTVADQSNEFLQISADELYAMLCSDDLNVKGEEQVFDAVVRWIDYDPTRRKPHMARMLRAIRLGTLPTQYFVEKVKPHPYIRESELCKPVVIETLKLLYDLDIEEDPHRDTTNPLVRPRVPHAILFAIGGWSGGSPTSIVETYDGRSDRWRQCEHLDTGPRAYHGTVAIGHVIYIVGGFDGMEYFNSCRKFDPVEWKWSETAPMHCKRCYVSVAVLDDMVYAMGGFNGERRHNTAERYSPASNQWTMIRPMIHQRSDASATTLDCRIYICGGFNGMECLMSAEYYDPSTDQWTMIAPMGSRRSGVGVVAYRDHVYAVGGFNSVTRMNTAERYNPKTDLWKTIPDMYNPRSNFAIEVVDDMMFAIGGFNGVTTIFNVECYDAATNEWYDATDMNLYRSALSACVVTGLPNVREYTEGREKSYVVPFDSVMDFLSQNQDVDREQPD